MSKRIYRLEVWYPEKLPDIERDGLGGLGESIYLGWPRERCYLSLSGAERRAALLRSYGCDVSIVRSKPIEWETAWEAKAMLRDKALVTKKRLQRLRDSL